MGNRIGSGRRGGVRARAREEGADRDAVISNAKLLKDNERLRKINAKLRRRLERYELADWEVDNEEEPLETIQAPPRIKCVDCGHANFQRLQTPTKVLYKCNNCGRRWTTDDGSV